MNNNDKMLQLVLSDEKLKSFYNYNPKDYQNLHDALKADNPIVVAVGKIILEVGGNSDKSVFRETYNEVVNYLNNNIL